MMTNLFSIFDPSLGLFSFSWLVIGLIMFFLPMSYWTLGMFLSFYHSAFLLVKKEVNDAVANSFKGIYSFMSAIFLFVFFCNFLALFPFMFSVTSHLLVTLPLSYSFWLGIIIFSWVSSFKEFLVHLIPMGTPLALMSFMVIVEVLSNFIRPLALTFRLTANMMAGHLLMSLVGNFLIGLSISALLLGSVLQSLLVLMELGVSFIQAYVFSVLLLLYLSEGLH